MPIPLQDMADKRHLVPVIIITAVSFFSCTLVKENRDPCPCLLDIHLSGTFGQPAVVLVEDRDGVQSVPVAGDTLIHVSVPRGGVTVTAWSGVLSGPSGSIFRILPGKEAPPLYLCRCRLEASGDLAIVHARLQKQFCTLRVSVEGPPGWGKPFGTRIRGSVCGMGLDGMPVEGEYSFEPDKSSGVWTARIPRQFADSPLLLDIVMEDSAVRTFSLGPYLHESGFDWSLPDLPDLDILLSVSVTSLTIRPPSWEPDTFMWIDI